MVKRREEAMTRLLAILVLVLASACGGSDSAPASEPPPATTGDESAPPAAAAECPLFCRPQEGSCKRPDYAEIPQVSCGAYSMGQLPDAPLVDCPAHCCVRAGDPASGDDDADGILNDADDCPNEPEQPDGFEDWDGCSAREQDNDSDGVEDMDDRCCYQAEDPDGVEDLDGCPEDH
jgi:hypothetical protein